MAIVTEELPYDASTIARNSVEEVRNFILTELAEVAEILPESYSGGFMNEIGRVTRYAAFSIAFSGRTVFLVIMKKQRNQQKQ